MTRGHTLSIFIILNIYPLIDFHPFFLQTGRHYGKILTLFVFFSFNRGVASLEFGNENG
jgi:hypothetical protein